jgi:hypothetical protein
MNLNSHRQGPAIATTWNGRKQRGRAASRRVNGHDGEVRSRPKKFVYKRATFAVEPEARTLEQLLNEAWQVTAERTGDRRQIIEDASGACVITHCRSQAHGMTFFELLTFTPGMKALAAKVDFTQPTIDIEEHDLKNAAGLRLELIQNISFVAVAGNDVVLLPSAELRSPEIEAHLNWLLSVATATILTPQAVRLSNRIPLAKEEAVKSATQIQFATELMMAATEEQGGQKRIRPHGLNWAGLRSLLVGLGPQMVDVTTDLELSGLTEASPVAIDITLSWPRPKKDRRHEVMDKIATGFRHLDTEIDFKIKTKNGWLKKQDLVIERMKSIRCRSERPVREFLWEAIHAWLVGLKAEGEIA